VGISISASGPAPSLGIPQRYKTRLLPKEIAGVKVNYIVLDDATDPQKARANAGKLAVEDSVDVPIGASIIPTAMGMSQIALETNTPLIALSPQVIQDSASRWVFSVRQTNEMMADVLIKHMQAPWC
jgi:branched-chain amino acid transport system substrate-binding protein